MNDLEMTKLCAKAMGYKLTGHDASEPAIQVVAFKGGLSPFAFDPLHNDEQAMVLLKKFPFECLSAIRANLMNVPFNACETNWLNHVIVKCVANMQQAKKEAWK